MSSPTPIQSPSRSAALLRCLLASASPLPLRRRLVPWRTQIAASPDAQTLPEDRGADGLAQTLRKLDTWASLMFIVAHPDDEDGGMLALRIARRRRAHGHRHPHPRRRRPECDVRRELRRAGADPHQRVAAGRSVFRLRAVLRHRRRLRLLEDHRRSARAVGTRSRPLRCRARGARVSPARPGFHLHRQHHRRPRPPSGFRRGQPGSLHRGRRSQRLPRSDRRRAASLVAAQGLRARSLLRAQQQRHLRLRHEQVVACALLRLRRQAVERQLSLRPPSKFPKAPGIRSSANRTFRSPAPDGASRNRRMAAARMPLPGPFNVGYHRYGSSVKTAGQGRESFFDGIDTSLPGIASLVHSGDTAPLVAALNDIHHHVATALYSDCACASGKDRAGAGHRLQGDATAHRVGQRQRAECRRQSQRRPRAQHQAGAVQHRAGRIAGPRGQRAGRCRAPQPAPTSCPHCARDTTTAVTPGSEIDVRVHVTAAPFWGPSAEGLQLARTWLDQPDGSALGNSPASARPASTPSRSNSGDAIFRVYVPRNAAAHAALLHPPQHRAAVLRHRRSALARRCPLRRIRWPAGRSSTTWAFPFASARWCRRSIASTASAASTSRWPSCRSCR